MSLRHSTQAIAILLVAAGFSAFANFYIVRPLDNDEGTELLQAEHLSLNRVVLLADAYPGGSVDTVEALPLYAHRLAWMDLMGHESATRAPFEFRARLIRVVLFVATAALIYLIIQASFGPIWAAAGALLWSGSAYALLMNQLLTRNAWSPLWMALALLAAATGWKHRDDHRVWLWWGLAMPLAFFGGLWSYSIFKAFAVALYLSLSWRILRERSWRSLPALAAGGIFLGAMLLAFIILSGITTQLYLQRGNYAIHLDAAYFHNLLRCFLMIFQWQRGDGTFVTEAVHDAVRSPLLAWPVAPFFIIGVFAAVRSRNDLLRICVGTLAAAWPILALAGPNLKYPYALAPLLIIVAVGGLRATLQFAFPASPAPSRGWGRILAPVAVVVYFAVGLRHILFTFVPMQFSSDAWLASRQIAATKRAVEAGRVPVWTVAANGIDVFRWEIYPPSKYGQTVRGFGFWDALREALAREPSAPAVIVAAGEHPVSDPALEQIVRERLVDPMASSPSH